MTITGNSLMNHHKTGAVVGAKLTLVILILTLTGCSTVPETTPQLSDATQAFEQAKGDPQVLRFAGPELDAAEKSLEAARAAKSVDDMDSMAYVADAQVKTALAITEREQAEERFMELSRVKDSIIMDSLKQDKRRLEDELRALKARKTDRGMVLTLGNVLFATNEAMLLPPAWETIDRLAAVLRKYPYKTVEIEGHTDNTGTAAYNLSLSQRRANAVRHALLARGITPNRVETVAFGQSRPVATNSTAQGRQQNRRVDIIIHD